MKTTVTSEPSVAYSPKAIRPQEHGRQFDMENPSTVFLVDDDGSVSDALKWLIESVEIPVETFASAAEFIESFDPTTPGCLILDVRMPGMSGLELQDLLSSKHCGLPIILITGHADVSMCVRAFEGGAYAFLEKPINQQVLLETIYRAIEEDQINRKRLLPTADVTKGVARLTPRERDVMDLLVSGHSMKEISGHLDISLPTCSKHRAKVLSKMNVDNDVQLVKRILAWRMARQ